MLKEPQLQSHSGPGAYCELFLNFAHQMRAASTFPMLQRKELSHPLFPAMFAVTKTARHAGLWIGQSLGI